MTLQHLLYLKNELEPNPRLRKTDSLPVVDYYATPKCDIEDLEHPLAANTQNYVWTQYPNSLLHTVLVLLFLMLSGALQ